MHYFFGPDTYAARQEISELANNHNAVIRWLDKEDLEQTPFSEWFSRGTSSLLGVELLVVRDPSKLPKSIQEDIIHVIQKSGAASPPYEGGEGEGCILWDRETPDKRSSLFQSLKPYSKEFSYPPRGTVVAWVREQAKQVGSAIDDAAARELVERLGPDRWRLASELEKLTLVQKSVSRKDVTESVPEGNIEEEVFAMLDALMVGNTKRAIDVMESLLRSGQSELYVLTMLAYQFRTLITIKAQLPHTSSPHEIAKRGKLHPYVIQKNLDAARTRSTDDIIDALTRVLATDVAIKSGKVDARTALVMLITQLARPVNPVNPARPGLSSRT